MEAGNYDALSKRELRKRLAEAERARARIGRMFLLVLLALYVWMFRDELVSLLSKLPPVAAGG